MFCCVCRTILEAVPGGDWDDVEAESGHRAAFCTLKFSDR